MNEDLLGRKPSCTIIKLAECMQTVYIRTHFREKCCKSADCDWIQPDFEFGAAVLLILTESILFTLLMKEEEVGQDGEVDDEDEDEDEDEDGMYHLSPTYARIS